MQEISPDTSIQSLLSKSEEELETSFFKGNLGGQEISFRFRTRDLREMEAMGLAELPVDAIAMPESSPLLQGRTTLLKDSLNISRQLTKFFPSRFVAALYEMQSLVNRGGFHVSVIGGVSRDLTLAEEKRLAVRDVDLTVEGDALACARYIISNSKNFTLDKEYEIFGTGKLLYKGDVNFDIASTRKEIYRHCGALPEVMERGVSLAEDSLRRDFTINALAMSINELGQILDYTHGLEDIHSKRIRVLHPVSFFEDPTRILRAFKFASRLDFDLSHGTRRLMEKFLQYGGGCYKGGGERVKYELKAFLSLPESPGKKRWLDYFIQQQCFHLAHMAEPYTLSEKFRKKIQKIADLLPLCWDEILNIDPDISIEDLAWQVYLCFLFQEAPFDTFQRISVRLGLTKEERDSVEIFRQLQERRALRVIHEQATSADIYELFHHRPIPAIVATIVEASFEKPGLVNVYFEALLRYKQKLENVHPQLNGNDLLALGVPQGVKVGQILKQLLHAKLSRRLPDRTSEVRLVQKILEDQKILEEIKTTVVGEGSEDASHS